jgi:CheY-specific phosphatase CheX
MDMHYIRPFVDCGVSATNEMAEIEIKELSTKICDGTTAKIDGFASIVGFSGQIEGWVMLIIDREFALRMACNIVGCEDSEVIDEEIISQSVSELCNVIVGNANTFINDKFQFRLKCAPPILFFGTGSKVILPQMKSCIVNYTSQYGLIKMIITFDTKLFH